MKELFDIVDSRDLGSVDGFDLVAFVVPDIDAETEDSPYGVIVCASKNGLDLGDASLWMTDADGFHSDGDDFVHGYGPSLIAEAVEAAKKTLAGLL